MKNLTSPNNRNFWRAGIHASLSVASWPKWKRSLGLSGEKPHETTAEDLKRMRDELLYYDALDCWTRKPCTDNLQYRPGYYEGRILQPRCNYGIGCATCWERYQSFYDNESKNWYDY
jgi:hypothetical protein